MRKHLHYIVFGLLTCLPFTVRPQIPGTPTVVNFSRTEYNAGTQNWGIAQDANGIMYFGNNKGLLEYDGFKWTLYPLPNRTVVRSVAIDPGGKIYVGGQNEFGYFEPNQSGRLQYHSMVSLIPESLRAFEDVWNIVPSPDGIFFQSQYYLFRFQEEKVSVFQPQVRFDACALINGKIYIADWKNGLFIFQEDKLNPLPQSKLPGNATVGRLLPGPSPNGLLILTLSNGPFIIDSEPIRPWEASVTSILSEYLSFSGIRLSDGSYVIGSPLKGMVRIEENGNLLMTLDRETGLQNNTVLTLFQDRDQNLWAGLDNGISYIQIRNPISQIGPTHGIEGTGYAAAIHNGLLYLGTNQGLFAIPWRNEVGAASSDFQLVDNLKGQVWDLDIIGGKLIAGLHDGVFEIDRLKASRISSLPGAWKFVELPDRPGYVIGGTYTGLVLYEKGDFPEGSLRFVRKIGGFRESSRVIERDPDGSLWISHAYKGVFRVHLNERLDSVSKVDFFTSADGFPSDYGINVANIRNEILFTTDKGVYRFEPDSTRFTIHPDFIPIFGIKQPVQRLIEDRTGNIWYVAQSGFGMLRVNETGIRTQIEKLPINHLREALVDGFECVFALSQTGVILGTEAGFISFERDEPFLRDSIRAPLIREVRLAGGRDSLISGGLFSVNGKISPIQDPDDAIRFPNQENAFRFLFAVPEFEFPGRNQYQYYLEGFDRDWSEWSPQTGKEYTNLPSGNYTFLVRAKNSLDQISPETRYSFSIAPPWYSTKTAKALYMLGGILFVWLLIRYYSRRFEREKDALKLEQANQMQAREAEFQEEAERSEAEIVRLRNEKLRAEIDHKNKELGSATMHLVQKGEILQRIKKDLKKLQPKAPPESREQIKQIVRAIDDDIRLDNRWEQFEQYFDQVHEDFLRKLRDKFPQLSPKDHRLCAYLRMNLSTKEIAPLMDISVRGVEISRYRLRKKLELDSDVNLVDFMLKV